MSGEEPKFHDFHRCQRSKDTVKDILADFQKVLIKKCGVQVASTAQALSDTASECMQIKATTKLSGIIFEEGCSKSFSRKRCVVSTNWRRTKNKQMQLEMRHKNIRELIMSSHLMPIISTRITLRMHFHDLWYFAYFLLYIFEVYS